MSKSKNGSKSDPSKSENSLERLKVNSVVQPSFDLDAGDEVELDANLSASKVNEESVLDGVGSGASEDESTGGSSILDTGPEGIGSGAGGSENSGSGLTIGTLGLGEERDWRESDLFESTVFEVASVLGLEDLDGGQRDFLAQVFSDSAADGRLGLDAFEFQSNPTQSEAENVAALELEIVNELATIALADHEPVVDSCGCAFCGSGNQDAFEDGSDNAPGPPPTEDATLQVLANYLTDGYWDDTGRSRHWFNVEDTGTGANSGTLYYNVSGFTSMGGKTDTDGLVAARQELVRDAFDVYEEILGINFVETTSQAGHVDFFFSDNYSGLNATYVYHSGSGGAVDFSNINLNASAYSGDATIGNSSFRTALHEIGHALGLGHQGNYNAGVGSPTYATSAHWTNDSTQQTMMSYWDQGENTDITASNVRVISPMAVDLLALDELYGSQTNGTQTFGLSEAFLGDTIFGVGTNITAAVSKAYSGIAGYADTNAFSLVDGGGIDTINLSNYSANQKIDLRPALASSTTGSISDVGGLIGNMTIAVGTVIENATSGSGNDTIYGNDENNALFGGAGNDTIYGEGGNGDTLGGGSGNDRLYSGDDGLYLAWGGDGDDRMYMYSGGANHNGSDFYGNAGDDRMYVYGGIAHANDDFDGGSGNDTLYFYGSSDALIVDLGAGTLNKVTNPFGTDLDATGFENIYQGTNHGDRFTGTTGANLIYGDGGNDSIYGAGGGDTLYGGAGNDVLRGNSDASASSVYGGSGDDTISVMWSQDAAQIHDGGTGNDTIAMDVVQYGTNYFFDLAAGTGSISGSGVYDVWVGFENIYDVFSNSGVNASGTAGANKMHGGGLTNLFYGLAGEDSLSGNGGNDTLYGGDDNDLLYGGADNDFMVGGDGNDSLYGGSGSDFLYGNSGSDRMYAGSDIDHLYGGDGTNYYYGGTSDVHIFGGTDADIVYGGAAVAMDIVTLFGGNDDLNTGSKTHVDDDFYGGAGHDTIRWDSQTAGGTFVMHETTGSWAVGANAGAAQEMDSFEHLIGTNFVDSVSGSSGNDTISSRDGNDTIDGGAGVDSIYGGNDDDSISGGAGNDHLYGGNGNDILSATSGNDTADGGAGNDSIYIPGSGTGSTSVQGGTGTDFLVINGNTTGWTVNLTGGTASGSSWTATVAGIENVSVWSGDDTVTGSNIANRLELNAGNDTAYAGAGNDTVYGQAGNDLMYGGTGNDSLYGGDDNDHLDGTTGFDTLYGGAGNDTLDSFQNGDTLHGGTGDDLLRVFANGQVTSLNGGDDTDTLELSGLGNWTVDLGAGTGSNGSTAITIANVENVTGGDGNDTITGNSDVNTLNGGLGNDVLIGGTGGDSLIGGAGIDTASYQNATEGVTARLDTPTGNVGEAAGDTYASIENLTGSAFNDSLIGDNANNVLRGEGGNDFLRGNGGDDVMFGGAANDTFEAGSGADSQYGGAGDDLFVTNATDVVVGAEAIYGGSGIDTLDFSGADGSVVNLRGSTIQSIEILKSTGFGTSFSRTLQVDGSHFDAGGISLTSEFDANGNAPAVTTISVFLDGQTSFDLSGITFHAVWDAQDIVQVTGTAIDETITGTSQADTIEGLGGSDKIYGAAGSDSLEGGGGDDSVYGGDAFDHVHGGLGNDRLYGGGSGDHMKGDGGDDYVYGDDGDDTMNGNDGNDRLYGGLGSDTLYGGAGDDYFRGDDTADSFYGGDDYDYISYYGSADGVTVDLGTNSVLGGHATGDVIDSIEGINGSNAGGDTITGTAGTNTIRGYGGEDKLYGAAGDDSLNGGDDNDSLYGGEGADSLVGGDGNDRLYGGLGSDIVYGGAGDDYFRGDDTADSFYGGDDYDYISYYGSSVGVSVNLTTNSVSGGHATGDVISSIEGINGSNTGGDTIVGTSGANTIKGYGGDDKFYAGSGSDKVYGGDGDDYVKAGGGTESFYGGAGTDDYISYYDSSNGITIYLETDSVTGSWANNDVISGFESAGGSSTGDDKMYGGAGENRLKSYGGNDSLYGGSHSDKLYGGSGNDKLYGGSSADSLYGSSGNDKLYGGSSTDTMYGSTGDDTLYGGSNVDKMYGGDGDDKFYGGTSNDKMYGGAGDDYFRADGGAESFYGGSGTDDFISYYKSSGGVTLKLDSDSITGSWGNNDVISGFESASGSNTGGDFLWGSAGANRLKGNGGDDSIWGRAGDDKLYGGSGNDRFDGGDGTDSLYGGSGADDFHFDRGEDTDYVKDFENNVDTVQFDNFGYLTDAASALAFATESGGDVTFDFGADGMLIVENTSKAALANDIEIV